MGSPSSSHWWAGILVALLLLPVLLFYVEASVGHDGLSCELGYDGDGAGTGDTGCGSWRR